MNVKLEWRGHLLNKRVVSGRFAFPEISAPPENEPRRGEWWEALRGGWVFKDQSETLKGLERGSKERRVRFAKRSELTDLQNRVSLSV